MADQKRDGMTLEEFREAAGADKVEARDNEGNILETTGDQAKLKRVLDHQVQAIDNRVIQQRLTNYLSGKAEPPNEFVRYLVDRVKAGNEEFQVVQQNLQQLNQRLAQLQKRAIQIQGEQNKYVQDIMAWWDRKPTDEKSKEETK